MHKRGRKTSGRLSLVADTIFSSLAGFVIIFVCILFFAFIITKIDATEKVISMMTGFALCVGAYAGGFISAKKRRRNGLFMGVICGLFMFLVILVIGSFFLKTVAGLSPSLKFTLTLICGGIGGIVGVNSKHSRF